MNAELWLAELSVRQVEYRKKYEESKGRSLVTLDTAEQRHHQENAVLHSQVTQHSWYYYTISFKIPLHELTMNNSSTSFIDLHHINLS